MGTGMLLKDKCVSLGRKSIRACFQDVCKNGIFKGKQFWKMINLTRLNLSVNCGSYSVTAE